MSESGFRADRHLHLGALSVMLTLLLITACSTNDSVYTGHFHAFGGLVDVTIVGVPVPDAQRAIAVLEEDFSFMEPNWNPQPDAPLTRVNQLLSTGEKFAAPPCILPLLEKGRAMTTSSQGLINPALGKLMNLWGFYDKDAEAFRPPSDESVETLVAQHPSLDDIRSDGVFLQCANPAVQLDFSGFMKGFAVDQAIIHLQDLGIRNAIINVGGDLHAMGSRAGHPWRVPIRRANGTGVLATIDIETDEAVFTAGASEQYRTWKGIHYHNILDPRTGRPAEGTLAVTVVHPDATLAHAAANALFIAGPEDWQRIAASMGVDQVVLMDAGGTIHVTPRLEKRLRFLQPPPQLRISEPGDSQGNPT